MKKYIGILFSIILVSCAAKKPSVITSEMPKKEVANTDKILKKYNQNLLDFSTLYIKSDASYSDKNQSQDVNAEIKIKKDEKILISIRWLGITMAKALITPNEVKYYEKLNGNYFEGDYKLLSKWLGAELNFAMLQNILIGKSFENLNLLKLNQIASSENYILQSNSDNEFEKKFVFDSENGNIKQQELLQISQGRKLTISYPSHQAVNQNVLPLNIKVKALQQQDSTNINLDYNHITINEELSFPFAVPEGYKRIFIN